MSSIDSQQVRLQLTKEPFVLAELRRKHVMKMLDGQEVYQCQFDSRTFTFKHGTIITVGRSVADALIRDAFVIVGPALDGDVHQVLDEVGSTDLGTGDEESSQTMCPVCHVEQGSIPALIDHLAEHNAPSHEAPTPAPFSPLPEKPTATSLANASAKSAAKITGHKLKDDTDITSLPRARRDE